MARSTWPTRRRCGHPLATDELWWRLAPAGPFTVQFWCDERLLFLPPVAELEQVTARWSSPFNGVPMPSPCRGASSPTGAMRIRLGITQIRVLLHHLAKKICLHSSIPCIPMTYAEMPHGVMLVMDLA